MSNVYQRLAEFLDNFPQRYPVNTESGIELKILEHIFTPEEAEMVMKLQIEPESGAKIADRIGSQEECQTCETCVERCQMEAISVDEVAQINLDRCIGCGVCAVTCDVGAISMHRKEKDKEFIPQKDNRSTMMTLLLHKISLFI